MIALKFIAAGLVAVAILCVAHGIQEWYLYRKGLE